jgi:hypothetical protein
MLYLQKDSPEASVELCLRNEKTPESNKEITEASKERCLANAWNLIEI